MKANPWLAIDVATAPTVRAYQLRDAWEQFVARLADADDDGDPPEVREPIADSWRRSFAAGVDPGAGRHAPVVADAREASWMWEEHPLARAAPLINACLAAGADEGEYLVVVSDANGMLLHIQGPAQVRVRAADAMNFAEGALWSEAGAGTNAIGTALAVDHAVQVFAAEHFNEVVQRWTCSAAPIHDPDTGGLLGVIDITADLSTVHPQSLAVATATAQAVEASLRCALQERDGRLRARYADRLAGSADRALVTGTGRVIAGRPRGWAGDERLVIPPGGGELVLPSGARAVAEPLGRDHDVFLVSEDDQARTARRAAPVLHARLLGRDRVHVELAERALDLSPRHGEVLALLHAHPEGLTPEALCAGLHGDGGSPGAVRVVVSRLRKLLGPCVDTERYRLTCVAETDVGDVEALLARGAVREAAERYAGPLLPASDAPGVVRERERLDAWVRQAVMSAEDADALWAWLGTTSGADDLAGWQRLLGLVAHSDPRRSHAAARVAQLRTELAPVATQR